MRNGRRLRTSNVSAWLTGLALTLGAGLPPGPLQAEERDPGLKRCGRYQVDGVIRKDSVHTLIFVTNEKTRSQNQFAIKPGELAAFAGYIDIPISAEMRIIHVDGTNGVVSRPENIRPAVPHPLNPSAIPGLVLLEKQACEW